MAEDFVVILFLFAFTFGIVGNYVYFKKVLPTLDSKESPKTPSMSPSGYYRDCRDFLEIIEKVDPKPWYYSFLKHQKKYMAIYLCSFFAVIIYVVSNQNL